VLRETAVNHFPPELLQRKKILDDFAKGADISRCAPHKTWTFPHRNPTMSEARPNFFDFDVTKMMADFRFRPFDVETLMASQRRNIEALSQANQVAVEGMQAVAKRQIEIARQTVEDVTALLRDLAQPASAEDRIAKNTEYAKKLLEKSVDHGREITMLATKAGTEAADVLRKRATEGLDEIRDLAKHQTGR
jgi:phasin family protein